MKLEGVFTALVTPFDSEGVDLECFRSLCHRQLRSGVSGLVPCGTTGETPTLNTHEWSALISCAVEVARLEGELQGQYFPVIAGCGSNATSVTLDNLRAAKSVGADAALVVFPYYNKPNPEGHIKHIELCAQEGLPLVLYHVPGRTGQRLSVDLLAQLCRTKGVVAIKEATGDVALGQELLNALSDTDASLLSGDDFTYAALVAMGFSGVISVLSNPAPMMAVEWYQAARSGDTKLLRELRSSLIPLVGELFESTNPLPCKALMAEQNLLPNRARLPLVAIPWSGKTAAGELQ